MKTRIQSWECMYYHDVDFLPGGRNTASLTELPEAPTACVFWSIT